MIPDAAIAGVRRTMDEMTSGYLARRGKRRYCDKSLGTARFAELLLRVYPEAKFLCLYRHPMDVIASGIEACPWGLNGYGFDPYIASTPGNMVWALASFWIDSASAALAAEERFAASCYRVRYEDLVADPETVADGIFEFLGVPPQPGISGRCFSPERERFGPADYKIWHTSKISAGSVGRGWSVPAGMIPAPVRQAMSELTGKLGYLPVDEKWGTAAVPADLRVAEGEPAAGAAVTRAGLADAAVAAQRPGVAVIGDHLRAGLARAGGEFSRRWGACSREPFMIVTTPPAGAGVGGREGRWRVDLAAGVVTDVTGSDGDDTAWDVVGSLDAWQAVLAGHTNLGVAMRRCELRYCDADEGDTADSGPVLAELRLGMLAELLGIAPSWQATARPVRPHHPDGLLAAADAG